MLCIGGDVYRVVSSLVLEFSFGVVVVFPVVVSSGVVSVGSGFCYVYVDNFSVVFCLVEFVDCFLTCCVVGHFDESESSGTACFTVGDYFC